MKKIIVALIAISLLFGASGVAQVNIPKSDSIRDVSSIPAGHREVTPTLAEGMRGGREICYYQIDTAALLQRKRCNYADSACKNIKYIFEATFISGEPFNDVNAKMTHYSQKILITKIYKNADGKLKLGTAQIIDNFTNYRINSDGLISIGHGSATYNAPIANGVYFCVDSDSSPHKIITDNDAVVLKQLYGLNKEDFYKASNSIPNSTITDSLIQKKSPNENITPTITPSYWI